MLIIMVISKFLFVTDRPTHTHTHTHIAHYTHARLSFVLFYLFCLINFSRCELLPNYYITCRVRDDAVSSVVRILLL